jgi:hypothetical protein
MLFAARDAFTKIEPVSFLSRSLQGMSRQGVYIYLQMKQPSERTRIHRPSGSSASAT